MWKLCLEAIWAWHMLGAAASGRTLFKVNGPCTMWRHSTAGSFPPIIITSDSDKQVHSRPGAVAPNVCRSFNPCWFLFDVIADIMCYAISLIADRFDSHRRHVLIDLLRSPPGACTLHKIDGFWHRRLVGEVITRAGRPESVPSEAGRPRKINSSYPCHFTFCFMH